MFVAAGCSEPEAAAIGRHLVDSDLTGHPSHGVVRVAGYVEALAGHRVFAGKSIEIVTETDVLAVVDGCFGFGQTVGGQAVALGIAKARRFGTNPIAIGLPQRGDEPLLVDFATSVVAEGKTRVALNGGAVVPDDALIGPDGRSTGDPGVLYGAVEAGALPNAMVGPGALRAMGDHKGSALSLACELLAGVLTGSGTAAADRSCNGMLSL